MCHCAVCASIICWGWNLSLRVSTGTYLICTMSSHITHTLCAISLPRGEFNLHYYPGIQKLTFQSSCSRHTNERCSKPLVSNVEVKQTKKKKGAFLLFIAMD